uniref:Uncharacterized protein n=1 Tax=Glossina brevipalpis TaxID=37001 RepID=A0A1A9X4E1_9MUSC
MYNILMHYDFKLLMSISANSRIDSCCICLSYEKNATELTLITSLRQHKSTTTTTIKTNFHRSQGMEMQSQQSCEASENSPRLPWYRAQLLRRSAGEARFCLSALFLIKYLAEFIITVLMSAFQITTIITGPFDFN